MPTRRRTNDRPRHARDACVQLQTDLEQTDRERADQQVARERVTAAEQETARMNAYMEQEIEELKGENLEQERMIAGLRRQMDEMERSIPDQEKTTHIQPCSVPVIGVLVHLHTLALLHLSGSSKASISS